MINLTTPLALPAPLSETLVNATVASARLDLLNGVLELVYVYGNTANGVFTGSPVLPGINVSVQLGSGAVFVRGNLVGWLDSASLTGALASIAGFKASSETFAVGVNVYPPDASGNKSATSTPLAIFQGTVA